MAQSVAEFLAQGGSIQTVATGVRARTESQHHVLSTGERTTFADVDRQYGGTLSDSQTLAVVERNNCE